MNTEIHLWLSQKSTKEIIKEVKELTKSNTSDNKTIKIIKDNLDDKLLVIRFKSFTGKQIDLADSIIKSYSHFLEEYSDISVSFETKTKLFSPLKKGSITKEDVVKFIAEYFKLLDEKKINLLVEYFDDKVLLSEKNAANRLTETKITTESYLSKIQKELSNLETNHIIKEIEIQKTYKGIECSFKHEIQRFLPEKDIHFHSFGKYVLVLYSPSKNKLKIVKITQIIEKNEGNETIFKKSEKIKK